MSALASSSTGNCFYVGNSTTHLLVDAGISATQIDERLLSIGRRIEDIDGIFVTHEHIDHVRGIEQLSRLHNLPVFCTRGTLENSYCDMGNVTVIEPGQQIHFKGFDILPFPVHHDAAEPVNYAIRFDGRKVSVITDVGHACAHVKKHISESDVLFLESNHDTLMLKNGRYPQHLKRRISSGKGHLSNYEAALNVLENATIRLRYLFLTHLSEKNNHPEVALRTFRALLAEREDLTHLKTAVTSKERPTEMVGL